MNTQSNDRCRPSRVLQLTSVELEHNMPWAAPLTPILDRNNDDLLIIRGRLIGFRGQGTPSGSLTSRGRLIQDPKK